MEVVVPAQNIDLNFNGMGSSPFGNYYFSAPTSPKQVSDFYCDIDEFFIISRGNGIKTGGDGLTATVPFDWEEKPGVPKSPFKINPNDEDDFAFDVTKEMERTSLSADELFDGGVIRPLKLPTCAEYNQRSTLVSPRSPLSHGNNVTRGRERISSLTRDTRSLSPLRVSEYAWDYAVEEDENQVEQNKKQSPMISSTTTSALWCSSSKGYGKWRFKDFFLFRSVSEGRTADKYPSKKYEVLVKKQEDFKCPSTREIESSAFGSSYKRRRRRSMSAHELHYTINRAVSEDLKKKTFLPYKQGILGRLAFNPALHAISNGFGFSRK